MVNLRISFNTLTVYMEAVSWIPPLENDDHLIWSATTPILCFWIVEMHQSDRVKLQFGYYQDIPNPPKCLQEEHTMTMQESWNYSYTTLNRNEQQLWENRHRLCLTGVTFQGEMKPTEEYINWLRHLPL